MDSFVDLIRKIGIFMIAAQAVIHFAPGQKYEKYLKLVVSIMILLQFLTPVYEILAKTGADWEAEFSALEEEFSGNTQEKTDAYMGTGTVTETLMNSMEKEIKSKLDSVAGMENYLVESVRVTIHEQETAEETVSKEYVLDQVRVVVRRRTTLPAQETDKEIPDKEITDKEISGIEISEIEVPDIEIPGIMPEEEGDAQSGAREGEGREEESRTEKKEAMEEALRVRFCEALGMEEKYMEVSLYGFVEDDFQ